MAALKVGEMAPEIELPGVMGKQRQKFKLSDFRGKKNVILAFYPADFSPVCGDQMGLYNEVFPEFQKHHAELLGISVDGAWCHDAFAKDRNSQLVDTNQDLLFETRTGELAYDLQQRLPTAACFLHECPTSPRSLLSSARG